MTQAKADDAERVLPGRVNAHTHLYSALVPLGMPAPSPTPKDFLEILRRIWWRLDRALDEASLRASARLYVAEALLHGTTTLVDHHESPSFIEGSLDVLADAAAELGTRLITCYGATERNDGPEEASRGLRECERFIRSNRRPGVRGMVGLHASFTVSDETLAVAGDVARFLGVPVHVHVAEDLADVEDAKRRGHADPLERLLSLRALPKGSILAHGVCLDEAAVRRAADAGLWLVQNPRSNRQNRVGYPRELWASSRVALGTDGYPADMVAEAAALAEVAAAEKDPGDLRARVDGGMRLIDELMGSNAWTGADQVVCSGGSVQRVVIDGQPVVEGGRLVRGDIEEIRARAREQAARLWKRMEQIA